MKPVKTGQNWSFEGSQTEWDQSYSVWLQSFNCGQWFGPVAVHGCPSWGSKNWTEWDLKTLHSHHSTLQETLRKILRTLQHYSPSQHSFIYFVASQSFPHYTSCFPCFSARTLGTEHNSEPYPATATSHQN